MIDLGPRIYGLGRTGAQELDCHTFRPKGKRKLFEDAELLDSISDLKRQRNSSPPFDSATTFEIVVVDENWEQCGNTISIPEEATDIIDLDVLGPLNGTSALHGAILREAQIGAEVLHKVPVPAHAPAHAPTHAPAHAPAKQASVLSDSDIGDLEWLINFKVDSVFESRTVERREDSRHSNRVDIDIDIDANRASESFDVHSVRNSFSSNSSSCSVSSPSSIGSGSGSGSGSGEQPCSTLSNSNANRSKSSQGSGRYGGPGKPPFTYTELIELALKDKGRLTVKEIYQWITKHFPFYKAVDERWKNSVRHNLSINPQFRKDSKAPQGAGHLWVVVDNTGKAKNSWKEERIQNFLASQTAMSETEAAAASISAPPDPEDPLLDLGVKMETPPPVDPLPPRHPAQLPSPPASPGRVSLERSAEEILSGIKRQVGVEYVPPVDLDGAAEAVDANAPGFLYPELSKEQLLAESGLYDELAGLCFINDMLNSNDQASDTLFSDDLGLSTYELPLTG